MVNWEILGIEPTKDERLIKSAYARQSKVYHVEENPEVFQILFATYKEAIKDAQSVIDSKSQVDSKRQTEQEESHFNFDEILKGAKEYEAMPLVDGCEFVLKQESRNKAMKTFHEVFNNFKEDKNNKSVRDFFISKTFLDNQYKEDFTFPLVIFLEMQEKKEVPILFYVWLQLVYGLYDEATFIYRKESLDGLSDIINRYQYKEEMHKLSCSLEIQAAAKMFKVYRELLWLYEHDRDNQIPEKWNNVLRGTGYELMNGDPIKRDSSYFQLLAYFIDQHKGLSKVIYKHLIKYYKLQDYKPDSENADIKPLYDVVTTIVGKNAEEMKQEQIDYANTIRILREEVETLYKQTLRLSYEEGQPLLQAFCEKEIFKEYVFDSEWMFSISVFLHNKNNCAYSLWEKLYILYVDNELVKAVLEEQKEIIKNLLLRSVYDKYIKYYEIKTQGMCTEEELEQLYTNMISFKPYAKAKEIKGEEERELWIKNNLFSDGYMDQSRRSMKGWTNELLDAFANEIDYETVRDPYGRLYVYYLEHEVVAFRDEKGEKVTLTHLEYYKYLKHYSEAYLNKFYCIPSERRAYAAYFETIESHLNLK